MSTQWEQTPSQPRGIAPWIWALIAVVLLVGIGGAVAAVALARSDDDEVTLDASEVPPTTSFSDPSQSVPEETIPAMESAAGKPCVAVVDPLPEGAPDVDVVVGPAPTELVITDLVEGTGDVVPAGATITADYIGVACSTGQIFDSSYSRGEPTQFPLDGVIQGWVDGIPGMKVGGQRLLGVPSEQAYGPDGYPGTIAPDEALWFVVEIKSIDSVPGTDTTAGS